MSEAADEKEKAGVSRVLEKMLDRLYASLLTGANLNCRPHASRQRLDVSTLAKLRDVSPGMMLRALLSGERAIKILGKIAAPSRDAAKEAMREHQAETPEAGAARTQEEKAAAQAWADQTMVVRKARTIAEDARTYEQDTGVNVLNIGFPLLSLPTGMGRKGRGAARRIMAPVAFIPVTVNVRAGTVMSVEIACRGDGVDLIKPNEALLAWLEQHTGKKTPALFQDEKAEEPWREICELVKHAAESVGAGVPAFFADGSGVPPELELQSSPRGEDEGGPLLVCGAVLGLFPTANEGLLRDMQGMIAGQGELGPAESFIRVDATLAPPENQEMPEAEVPARPSMRIFKEERLIAPADPCQARAVRVARSARGLVIHGPPGTGKSQTITNIIGDHLARGQRVLMVCDKRTALDVVKHRLDAQGLGRLVAVVHDPQQDQRDLYMTVRNALEELPDLRTHGMAGRQLGKIDGELEQIHGELTSYWRGVMLPHGMEASFHELIGRWLAIESEVAVDEKALAEVSLDAVRLRTRDLQEIFARGETAGYAENPWAKAAGVKLADLFARPTAEVRESAGKCAAAARAAEIAVEPAMPALAGDLQKEASGRRALAERIEAVTKSALPEVMAHWAGKEKAGLERARQVLGDLAPMAQVFRARRLDAEMLSAVRDALPSLAAMAGQLGVLAEYLEATAKWTGIFAMGPKKRAKGVLRTYGVTLSRGNARRAQEFLQGLRARLILRETLAELMAARPAGTPGTMQDDEAIEHGLASHEGTIGLLLAVLAEQGHLKEVAQSTLRSPESAAGAAAALRASAERAEKIAALDAAVKEAALFDGEWWNAAENELRRGGAMGAFFGDLETRLDTLENVVRIKHGLADLETGLRSAALLLLAARASASDGLAAIERGAIAAELTRRIRGNAQLHALDGQRLKTNFDRYRELELEKRGLVRLEILHQWVSRQKQRLLAMTGSRLSGLGADLKRRLTTRGERALRLRQVIAVGRGVEGGDPLFDMCPVWMASPETVAELFERAALFDVVIFDEASQCRLEEALPVLTRAKRVVIAGDPKQLPPTRFFESAISSGGDEEMSTEQDLFEHQQSEVEDLLAAALNLQIDQAFLDVHYRSRNADLIEFSNQQFYHARLQAIPGHPDNKAVVSPLTLYRADGIYEDRCNPKEAEAVCRIVRDLLKRAEPPSIGIACFNLQQRDTIVDALDEMAAGDEEFAGKLAAARARKGSATFEGLFVKNLENVQGDERDHIIISTTYGPDKTGRFFQRFGPLGRVGGGRRLNVLVTRAREEVHLVSSIPAEKYRSLPPVPPGQTAGGGWLLYSYLRYAEALAEVYKERNAREEARRLGADGETSAAPQAGVVNVMPIKNALASPFSESVAMALGTSHGVSSDVHWGNDGFCVDVALRHPIRPDGVTIGVLCDGARFTLAEDPVEWDVFRTTILEDQGWSLRRVWSPHFFRDANGMLNRLVEAHTRAVSAEPAEKG